MSPKQFERSHESLLPDTAVVRDRYQMALHGTSETPTTVITIARQVGSGETLSDLLVVAGHKKDVSAPDSPDALVFMNSYLSDFDSIKKSAADADALRTAMLQKYPDLAVRGLLAFGARAAFQK